MMSEIINLEFKKIAIEVGFDTHEEDGEFLYAETQLAFKLWQVGNVKELEMAISLAEQAETYQKLYTYWKFELDQGLVQHELKILDQLEKAISNSIVKHQRVVIVPYTGHKEIDETDMIFTVTSINSDVDMLEIRHPNGAVWSTHIHYIRPATRKEILMQKRLDHFSNQ